MADDRRPLVRLAVDLARRPAHRRPPVVQEDVGQLRLGLVVAVHLVDDEVAAGTQDPQHLGEDRCRILEVVERVRDADGVERRVGEGEVVGVHRLESHARPVAQRGGEGLRAVGVLVDPHDLVVAAEAVEEERDERAGAGGDVEDAAAVDRAEDGAGVGSDAGHAHGTDGTRDGGGRSAASAVPNQHVAGDMRPSSNPSTLGAP